jgi:uncharacterized repeat protein (TIGR03803 family)
MAGLTIDRDNNLYGTTVTGGVSNYGAVFKIDSSGHESILYSFGAIPDGQYPFGGLVMDANGNLYGTTQQGGDYDSCWGNCGTVFKLDKSGSERVLFNFAPPAETPTATLTPDAAGNLYGITSGNGYCCLGTVFKMSNDIAPGITTLYTFSGGATGEAPFGGVVRDSQGRLYGMAFRGGNFNCIYSHGAGCGIIYELNPGGDETVLHSFAGPPDGALPQAGLLRDDAGNLYGTTSFGGADGYGTVFKLNRHGKMTILHNFSNKDGATPYSTLIRDAAGNLYGTTWFGGNFACNSRYGCGVVFKISP